MKNKVRYGVILLNKTSKQLYVVRRINYILWNRMNNVQLDINKYVTKLHFLMYPGVDIFLEFPKGVKEKNETGLECAVREFYEETGVKVNVDKTEILDQIQQNFEGDNGKSYLVNYFMINDSSITASKGTVVRNIESPAVLSDTFNVLVLTQWKFIRDYFVSSNLMMIVSGLDDIFID